jgi:hypothetical protein
LTYVIERQLTGNRGGADGKAILLTEARGRHAAPDTQEP